MIQPEILYEDAQLIICYKPAGIATQTKKLGQKDMVSKNKNNTIATPDRPRNLLFLLIGFPLFVLLFAIHQCFK